MEKQSLTSAETDEIFSSSSAESLSLDSFGDIELDFVDVIEAIHDASTNEIHGMSLGFTELKEAINQLHQQKEVVTVESQANSDPVKVESQTDSEPVQVEAVRPTIPSDKTQPQAISVTEVAQSTSSEPSRAKKKKALTLEEVEPEIDKAKPKEAKSKRKPLAIEEVGVKPSVQTATKAAKPAKLLPVPHPSPVNKVANDEKRIAQTQKSASLIDEDILKQYYRDDNGRLRNEKGKFASSAEQRQYEKNESKPEGEKKETSLLKSLIGSAAKIVNIGSHANNPYGYQPYGQFGGMGQLGGNTVRQSAGMAMGGSYFVAAQELGHVFNEVKDSFESAGIKSFGDAVDKVKEKVSGASKGALGVAKAVQVKLADAKEEKTKQDKKPNAFKTAFEKVKGKLGVNDLQKEKPATEKLQDAVVDKNAKADSKAPSWMRKKTNPLYRLFNHANKPVQKAEDLKLKEAKKQGQKSEQQHTELVTALGDIEDAIKLSSGNGGGGGGLLDTAIDEAFDYMGDRRKRKRRRKRTGRTRRFSRLPDVDADTGRRTRTKPVSPSRGAAYGRAGRAIPSVAAEAAGASRLSKAGGMLKGAAKFGGAALSKLALPLTVLMAAKDGYDGFNDAEAQKSAFKLKEGEEASLGQKLSMGAGSILSMGGLTDYIGFSGEDIAKGIYQSFGGDIEGEEKPLMSYLNPVGMAVNGSMKAFDYFFGDDKEGEKDKAKDAKPVADKAASDNEPKNTGTDKRTYSKTTEVIKAGEDDKRLASVDSRIDSYDRMLDNDRLSSSHKKRIKERREEAAQEKEMLQNRIAARKADEQSQERAGYQQGVNTSESIKPEVAKGENQEGSKDGNTDRRTYSKATEVIKAGEDDKRLASVDSRIASYDRMLDNDRLSPSHKKRIKERREEAAQEKEMLQNRIAARKADEKAQASEQAVAVESIAKESDVKRVNQSEDIEQIEAVNNLQKNKSGGNPKDGAQTKLGANSSTISKSDPEVVKLLKSIDKRLSEQSKSESKGSSNKSHRGVPMDFSDIEHRRQANNLG